MKSLVWISLTFAFGSLAFASYFNPYYVSAETRDKARRYDELRSCECARANRIARCSIQARAEISADSALDADSSGQHVTCLAATAPSSISCVGSAREVLD